MEPVRSVVSLDIGGTLGDAQGPGIAAYLAAASPLGPRQARRIMRDILHTAPRITDAVIERVCQALGIAASAFPRELPVAPLELFPGTVEVLRELSAGSTLVTLSNVICTEAEPERLDRLLTPWVSAQFPSCRTGFAKPDRRAFQMVADTYRLPPEQLVHVGDDWECDVIGAAAAGLSAVWISRGRAVPGGPLLVEHDIRVAYDLADAVQHVRHLLQRRTP